MSILNLAFWLVFQTVVPGRHGQESASNIVFQSVDGGQTWQDVSPGLPWDVAVGDIFANDDEVLLGTQAGLYRSSTASATPVWENLALMPEMISCIFPGREGPYACSYGGGIFQEVAGTGLWIPIHNDLKDKNVHTLLETPFGAVFVGCDSGIFKSVDSGKTWNKVFKEGQVLSLVEADGILIGGGFRGILRSTDGGDHWDWVMTEDGAALSTELIEGGVAAITYDGSTKRLCTSADSGKTWKHVEENVSEPVKLINEIKQAGTNLFWSREAGIFRSSDQGKTWELVFPSTGKQLYHLAVSGQVIFVLRVSGC